MVQSVPMQVTIRQVGETVVADLSGDWAIERPTPRFDRLIDERSPAGPVKSIGFDTSGLGAWDSALLTFLLQGVDYCEAHGLAFAPAEEALGL